MGSVFQKPCLRLLLIEGQNYSIRQNFGTYWAQNPDTDFGTIQQYENSIDLISRGDLRAADDEDGRSGKRIAALIVQDNLTSTMSSPGIPSPIVKSRKRSTSMSETSLALIEAIVDTEIVILRKDGAKLTDTDIESLRASIAMNSGETF